MNNIEEKLTTFASYRHAGFTFFTGKLEETVNADGVYKKSFNYPKGGWKQSKLTMNSAININDNATCIITGEESNIWVVDFDFKDDHTINFYHHLINTYGCPNTYIVQSGNGGFHWYFKLCERTKNLKNHTGLKANGVRYDIDIRAEGGHIYSPPTQYISYQNSDKPYIKAYTPISHLHQLSEAPEWIFQLFDTFKDTKLCANHFSANHFSREKLTPQDAQKIKDLLDIISLEFSENYEDWMKVGYSLYNMFKGSEDGLYLFAHFHQTYYNSNPQTKRNVEYTWNHFKSSNEAVNGIGTLCHYAKQSNPQRFEEWKKKYNPPVKITFTPDEIINTRYIPSSFYQEHLKNCDILALQSNMNTGKTYGLSQHVDSYKRIAVIYFRVSLNKEIYEKWKHLDFAYYKDIEGPINSGNVNRIIIQIDSIHRLRGKFDLLILDELESTLSHLMTSKFIDVNKCWNSLHSYIKHTPKIVAMDATLQDQSIKTLFNSSTLSLKNSTQSKNCIPRRVFKVQNTYKSYANLQVTFYNKEHILIKNLLEDLSNNKNIVIPTNSFKAANKLEKIIQKFRDVPILKINKHSTSINPEEWTNYRVVIFTPTVTAGISYDHIHFHKCYAFFTNKSCDSEMSSQMLCRVRNLIDNELHICTPIDSKNKINTNRKALDELINNHLQNNMNLGHSHLNVEGLQMDNYNCRAKRTKFYQLFRNFIKKQRLSQYHFTEYLKTILEQHGMTVNFHHPTEEDDIQKSLKTSIAETSIELKKEEAEAITKATPITQEQYNTLLQSTEKKSENQMQSIKQFKLCKTFNKQSADLLVDWVKKHIKCIKGYTNFKVFADMSPDVAMKYVQQLHEEKYNEAMYDLELNQSITTDEDVSTSSDSSNDESDFETQSKAKFLQQARRERRVRKHQSMKSIVLALKWDTRWLKIKHCFGIIKAAGFNGLKDNRKIKLDWVTLHRYCKNNELDIRTLWNVRKMDWNEEFEEEDKNSLMKYIQAKLLDVFSLSIESRNRNIHSYQISYEFDYENNDNSYENELEN